MPTLCWMHSCKTLCLFNNPLSLLSIFSLLLCQSKFTLKAGMIELFNILCAVGYDLCNQPLKHRCLFTSGAAEMNYKIASEDPNILLKLRPLNMQYLSISVVFHISKTFAICIRFQEEN